VLHDYEETPQFAPKAAILAACAFSLYFGYMGGGGILRGKLPIAGWFIPAFPLVCLLLPEGPDVKPEWPAAPRRRLQLSYTVLRVAFSWTMAIACVALSTTNVTLQGWLLLAISCALGAVLWAGRVFTSAKKELASARRAPANTQTRAGVDFFEDACPHCGAKLAVFPEDGERVRCACGAVLKVERKGKAGSLSVAELP
jgi:hypothetical protein